MGRDLTLSPCCVVRNEEGMAAHGETMREAMTALMEKEMENRSPEDRVAAFLECHDTATKYPAQDLFEWHHHLTGSCLAGRKAFCRDHGIDIEHDAFTVEEFVRMTKGNYGADVIDLLAERIRMTDVRDWRAVGRAAGAGAGAAAVCGDRPGDGGEGRGKTDGEVGRAMTGKPQTILELLQAITGWSNEDIVRAFGEKETKKETENERG